MVVEVGLVDPRVDGAQRVDDRRRRVRVGVVALEHQAAAGVGRSVSPRDCDVIEPPTNSSATDSPRLLAVRTSPAMNVWMSPVMKTTSLMPVGLDVGEQLLALGRVALPVVEAVVAPPGSSAFIIITSLPTTFQAAPERASRCLAQSICVRPRNARGSSSPAHGGDGGVAARLVVAVLALVEHDQVDVACRSAARGRSGSCRTG